MRPSRRGPVSDVAKIIIGSYYEADSVLHRCDPRTKISLSILYIVAVFLAPGWWGLLSMAVFTGILILFSQVPLKVLLRSVYPLMFILIFAVLLNLLFTTDGIVYWHWGVFTITDVGCYRAAFYPCRMALILIGMSLLTLTTTPIGITDGMEAIMRPFRRFGFPAHELAMMTGIAMRFLPVFTDELDKIRRAQESRGADFGGGGLIARARKLVPLMVPLFMSAFRHAENLATAMESRCYHGGEGRTRLHALVFAKRDRAAFALFGCLMVAVVAMHIVL